jgi:hypothetical protein
VNGKILRKGIIDPESRERKKLFLEKAKLTLNGFSKKKKS